jgi:gamma-glutamyltranspeptidase/glutathione hydrolase
MPSDSLSAATGNAATTYRPVLLGTRHMAVAGHYSAAHAAFQVLEAGGNAVDAGVAGGLALGVLLCDLVNVAGVAPILISLAERDEVLTISGLGTAPMKADVEFLRREHGGAIPPGLLRTVVPAAPDAWIIALERYGTMSFGEVAEAAIRFARDGFPMHAMLASMIELHRAEYARWPSNAAIYLPGARVPKVGEIFVQADLARTLQHMVDEEKAASKRGREAGLRAARDAFYKGDIAATIARYNAENGGWLSREDMAEFQVGIEKPATTRFGDIELFTCGPWCQGPMLAQALNLLDGNALKSAGHNSPGYIHTVAEALKLAFADRERWYGDPRFVDVPLEGLLSRDYAGIRRRLIRADKAWPGLPPAGDPRSMTAEAWHLGEARATAGTPRPPLDTSYVCVVDRWGNVFSATPSDVTFESPIIPGTGLCPSSRGSQFWTEPGHPSVLAPGKRPRLTPNPAFARKKGELLMPFGTPGGDVQAQAMLQVLLNVTLFGMDPQAAVEAPRFASYSFPDSFEPHEYFPGRLMLESRVPRESGDALKRLGHDLSWWPDFIWRAGAVCTIAANRKTGVLAGGADPRRPTYACGW